MAKVGRPRGSNAMTFGDKEKLLQLANSLLDDLNKLEIMDIKDKINLLKTIAPYSFQKLPEITITHEAEPFDASEIWKQIKGLD